MGVQRGGSFDPKDVLAPETEEEDRKCAPAGPSEGEGAAEEAAAANSACNLETELTEWAVETEPTEPATGAPASRTTTTARPARPADEAAGSPSLDVLARELGSKSMLQLRRLAMGVDGDIGGCVEKREIVERIAEAMVDGRDFKEICGPIGSLRSGRWRRMWRRATGRISWLVSGFIWRGM
mmetsp:Transcript_31424/g.71908  ORF Transcript_31424/g.71908 Transcript_31424/m.71908 type:complete len:182 (-) Transcript_31424:101-646(-)